MNSTILQNHVSPPSINDTFSNIIWNAFLEELDPYRLYFTTDDLTSLEAFKYKVLSHGDQDVFFLDKVIPLYKECLLRAERNALLILQKPFSWQESGVLRIDSLSHAANESELLISTTAWLKYKTLERMYTLEMQNTSKATSTLYQEQEARKQVLISEKRNTQRILNHSFGFENYVATSFFRTIAMAFDPHSLYFSPTEMENFMTSLSAEGLSLGLVLDDNERGEVVVSYLIPGGPAWKSGDLHVADVLVQARWGNQGIVDLFGMNVEEVGELMEEMNHDLLELTVRGAGGIQKSIRLRKEVIALEENVVRSFVLKGARTVGYISLPGFYTSWSDEQEGARCANDVAKEIIKLKNEKIEGLILDIRYNGGGSLQEAMEMAGIFIEDGVVGMTKNSIGKISLCKDSNRGTIYDGPLVLMVNRHSASASEFLAATLQDYNRALIVGSQTFGKATLQNIFPLDPTGNSDITSLNSRGYGYVTVTKEKFYRVTGLSTQGNGVSPDIQLPHIFDELPFYEAALPQALQNDSVLKKVAYQALSSIPIRPIQQLADHRIDTSRIFKSIRHLAQVLSAEQSAKQFVPLSRNAYVKYRQTEEERYNQVEALLKGYKSSFDIVNHTSDNTRMQVDEFMVEFNQHWIKKLVTDVYLDEAFRIMCDYISLKRK